MSRALFFDAVWYKKYDERRSGGRLLNILGSHNLREKNINKNYASGKKNKLFKILKSSLDALHRLYRPDRPRVVEAVLNNSFFRKKILSISV